MGRTLADKIELLSPAGDMEKLKMAITYGADAVYLAGQLFGMRASAGNFNYDELKTAVELCHNSGVKTYVTCNTLPRNKEIDLLPEFLEFLESVRADGVIVTDVGVFAMAGHYAPHVPRHVSTQAGLTNYAAANTWHEMGAGRVILARELSIEEIADIRANTPKDMEIEAFVHGSMCVSFSGRCLLSNYMTGRDANRGACAQPCRWKYSLMEEKRPGEYFDIFEDGGTHILNSRDMCMIEHLPEMAAAGVTSLKIEGRMKSSYYVATITNAYRKALNALQNNENLAEIWIKETEKVSHRHYYTGFYLDIAESGQYYKNSEYLRPWEVSAIVLYCDGEGNALVSHRNRFATGETLELLTPAGEPVEFIAGELRDESGQIISEAIHPTMNVYMHLPRSASENSIIRKKK